MISKTQAPRLTYRDVLSRLILAAPSEGYAAPSALPQLTDDELAAIARHSPSAWRDAMAEAGPGLALDCADFLSRMDRSIGDRLRAVGLLTVGAFREHILPLVLRDVQLELARVSSMTAAERESFRTGRMPEQLAAQLDRGVAHLFRGSRP